MLNYFKQLIWINGKFPLKKSYEVDAIITVLLMKRVKLRDVK